MDPAVLPVHGLAGRFAGRGGSRPAAATERAAGEGPPPGYFSALPMTAYNAVTPVETEASKRLVTALRRAPGGGRLQQVMWAASGSEAIQKALWAGLARDRARPMILATRFGFHGKKGLAGAVTGTEHDAERDPRVRFVSFPMRECLDVANRNDAFDPAPYRKELDDLRQQFGRKLGMLITEPYLGGGGSFHPPKAYLQMLQQFCRENDIVFILDEVQANFGRTGQTVRVRNLRTGAGHRRLGQGARQRRAGRGRGRPGGPVRGPRLRRRVRHLERQPALLLPPSWPRWTSSRRGTCSARPARRRR